MWDLQGVQSFPKNLAESEGLKFNVRSSHVEIWQMESGVWSKQADWDCGQRPRLRKKLGYKPHPLGRGWGWLCSNDASGIVILTTKGEIGRLRLDSKTTIEENPPWPPTLQNCSLSWKVALVQSLSKYICKHWLWHWQDTNLLDKNTNVSLELSSWGKAVMWGCLV